MSSRCEKIRLRGCERSWMRNNCSPYGHAMEPILGLMHWWKNDWSRWHHYHRGSSGSGFRINVWLAARVLLHRYDLLLCSGCKDKKKTILVKQTQDQQKVLNSLNHGIPLIASSPVSNDMNMGLPPPSLVQVQYHSGGPWKTFNAYPPGHPMHHQQHQQSYHDLAGFGSEDDSTCFDTSQFSEERSDTSCDGSGTSQLTLL